MNFVKNVLHPVKYSLWLQSYGTSQIKIIKSNIQSFHEFLVWWHKNSCIYEEFDFPARFIIFVHMIKLTDSAVSQVSKMLSEKEEGMLLRIFIEPGGCSGFEYGIAWTTSVVRKYILMMGWPAKVSKFETPMPNQLAGAGSPSAKRLI
jgi:hypothetical protein